MTKLACLPLALLAAAFAGCASTASTPAAAPPALQVPAGQKLVYETHARGVQIYHCTAGQNPTGPLQWTLVAPEAELYDDGGRSVGRHYAGPSWELYDGSKVVAEVKARDNGPDPNSIPWLLLSVKSNSGNGQLGHAVSVQRLYTVGGKAPADGCDTAHGGAEARVHYTADYYFYSAD